LKKPIEVLLLSAKECRYTQDGADTPPLGIMYIASYVIEHGYSARVMDLNYPTFDIETLVEYVSHQKSLKIVGLSSTTISYLNGMRTAERIKTVRPDIITVMGGPHVSFDYVNTLNSGFVDYVVRSDGEEAFLGICNLVIKNEGNHDSIPNLVYKENEQIKVNEIDYRNQIDINTLPYPKRSMVDLNSYFRPFHIMTTRGCPGKCSFCAASALTGRCLRKREVDNIIKEIEYISQKFNGSTILIADDTFTFLGKERVREIAKYLKRKDIIWSCESRVDVKNLDIFHILAENNCVDIQIGIESFNQSVLNSVDKKISTTQIEEVLKTCKKLGISVFGNVIIGLPDDTEESFLQTLDTFLYMVREYSLSGSCSICTPFPGTDIYVNPEKHGLNIIETNWDLYDMVHPIAETRHMSLYKQKELHYKFFNTYIPYQTKWQVSHRNINRDRAKFVYT